MPAWASRMAVANISGTMVLARKGCLMNRRSAFSLGLAIVAMVVMIQPAAGDWPQWRGPARDCAAAPGTTLPDPLPEALKPLWKTEVGEGYSTPIILGEKVFVFSRVGENEVCRALDAATGATLWQEPMTRRSSLKGPL